MMHDPISGHIKYLLNKIRGTTTIALISLVALGLLSGSESSAVASDKNEIAGQYSGQALSAEKIRKLVDAHEQWVAQRIASPESNRMGRLDFRGVILLPTRISLQQCDLRYADFRGAELPGLDLIASNLERARLDAAHLDHSDLLMARLNDASLRGATLWDADLRRSNLTGADLEDAVLDWAAMCDVELRGAKLKGASFAKTDMRGACYEPSLSSPPFIDKIANAKNLGLMWYRYTPAPMEQLRDRFRAAGLHRQARDVSVALFFSRLRDGGKGIRDRLVTKAQEAVGWILTTYSRYHA